MAEETIKKATQLQDGGQIEKKTEPDKVADPIVLQPKQKKVDEFLGQQKLLIEKLDVISEKFDSSKKKDIWDRFSSLTGVFALLSSIVIAYMGYLFTNQYKEQEVQISRTQTIEKLLPYLNDPDNGKKSSALLTIAAIENKEFAAKLATSYANFGTIDALKTILKGSPDGDTKKELEDALFEAFISRARVNFRNGSTFYESIIEDFTRAFELRNSDYVRSRWGEWYLATIYVDRGNVYRENAKYDIALADYDEALKLTPNNSHAFTGKAILYRYKGEYDTALSLHDEAIKNYNWGDHYLKRAQTYEAMNKLDEAKTDYDNYISVNNDLDVAFLERGLFFLRYDKKDQAISDLEKAIKITKSDDLRTRAMAELTYLEPNYEAVENKENKAVENNDRKKEKLGNIDINQEKSIGNSNKKQVKPVGNSN